MDKMEVGREAVCGVRKLRGVIQEMVKGPNMFTQRKRSLCKQGYILRYVKSYRMGKELDLP